MMKVTKRGMADEVFNLLAMDPYALISIGEEQ